MNPPSKHEDEQNDPWSRLSPVERKRAERHLLILYASMVILIVFPFIFFMVFR
jgi:hypothetical protein